MEAVPNPDLYRHVQAKMLEELHPTTSMEEIIKRKISHLARGMFSSLESYTDADYQKAKSMAQTLGKKENDPHFRVIIQACHDFRVILEHAKRTEGRIFHIETAPAISLVAVPTQIETTRYTMLEYAQRPAEELLTIARVFKLENNLRDAILVRPERLVLHNLLQSLILNYGLEDNQGKELETSLQEIIPPLQQEFFNKYPEFSNAVNEYHKKMEQEALLFLSDKYSGKYPYEDQIKSLQASLQDSDIDSNTKNQAIAKRIADLLVKSFVKEAINHFVLKENPQTLLPYHKLPPQSNRERRYYMINGGIASGKGSAKNEMRKLALAQRIHWNDICVFNGDALKPLLLRSQDLPPEQKTFLSALTQDEVYAIRENFFRDYKERLAQDTAPHFFWDQVRPLPEMFEIAADSHGLGLELMVVHLPVEHSFRLAYLRGRETGRFETTKGILNTHAMLPKMLVDSLRYAKEHGKMNIRMRIVANIGLGKVQEIFYLDLANKELKVEHFALLEEFFKKTTINLQAHTFDDIYPTANEHRVYYPLLEELTNIEGQA